MRDLHYWEIELLMLEATKKLSLVLMKHPPVTALNEINREVELIKEYHQKLIALSQKGDK